MYCILKNTTNSRRVSDMSANVQPFAITQSRTSFRDQSPPPPFVEDFPPSYEMAVVNSLQKTNMQSTDVPDESNN
ncbi:unnamed protein product [Rotaria sp. Silwood1]|nr:unnamed protein product [Rotaria sp. Silwood1]